jgi:hypothetical protein
MTLNEKRVADLIKHAFQGVELGDGIGLWQAQGLDDYADAKTLKKYRDKDEKHDWSRISVVDIKRCHSSLSFFDAEGMRFHLPAFLIAQLEGATGFDVLFSLTFFSYDNMDCYKLLDATQRNSVREYLLLEYDSENEMSAPLIKEALEKYWLPITK